MGGRPGVAPDAASIRQDAGAGSTVRQDQRAWSGARHAGPGRSHTLKAEDFPGHLLAPCVGFGPEFRTGNGRLSAALADVGTGFERLGKFVKARRVTGGFHATRVFLGLSVSHAPVHPGKNYFRRGTRCGLGVCVPEGLVRVLRVQAARPGWPGGAHAARELPAAFALLTLRPMPERQNPGRPAPVLALNPRRQTHVLNRRRRAPKKDAEKHAEKGAVA